ncbi:type II secretion system protein [Fusibacter paucivorans]|uniref:Type II secretion system protein n=2 Tax=Fusibacter paucivorans TaxID=76009 RepID=A0ABS5PSN8_9FIRM|nr:type II secretion system protein [Fusibacter paucivorans]
MIELIVVIAIISTLLLIGAPIFLGAKQMESNISLEGYENEITMGLKQYYVLYGKQISQTTDATETTIAEDNADLTVWMTTLHDTFDIAFRGGYTYRYINSGLFGKVEIEETH